MTNKVQKKQLPAFLALTIICLIAALALESATVRTPGGSIPFAMAIGVEAPIYLGLALD